MNQAFHHIAFQLFREFTKNASIHLPECNFEIIDETLLVNDVANCFNEAIENLQTKKEHLQRKQIGYDYGYMLGFVQSSLNVQWHHQYIEKQTQAYKKFLVFKSMEQFFRLDTITVDRLTKLYYHLLYDEINLMNMPEEVHHQQISAPEVAEINTPKDNPILQMINNQITDYLNEYLKTEKINFMPNLKDYFTYSNIKEFFKHYQEV
jgi:hypothetical protein